MPQSSLYIHCVWTTKHRFPYLTDGLRAKVIEYISSHSSTRNISIISIGGYTDHLHVLIRLHTNQSLSQVVQIMKGASSRWINKHNLSDRYFVWQVGFWATSVSPDRLKFVERYIEHQSTHHQKQSCKSELKQLFQHSVD